jgi:hypothetical protein
MRVITVDIITCKAEEEISVFIGIIFFLLCWEWFPETGPVLIDALSEFKWSLFLSQSFLIFFYDWGHPFNVAGII